MTGPAPDTDDLRAGAPISEALLAVLPLVGTWNGTGTGVSPAGEHFSFGQQVRFVHDGRPFLAYESRSWLIDDAGAMIRPAWRESGFWRMGAGPDDVEAVLASNTGEVLVYAGSAGHQRWELATTTTAATPTAKPVDEERRLYAVMNEELVYVAELAPAGRPLAPHLNARLARVPAPPSS